MALIGKVLAGQAALETVELLGGHRPAPAVMAALPVCKHCGAGMESDVRFCSDRGKAC